MTTTIALGWFLIMQCRPMPGFTGTYDGHAHAIGNFATDEDVDPCAGRPERGGNRGSNWSSIGENLLPRMAELFRRLKK
jgi:hypothetical protein